MPAHAGCGAPRCCCCCSRLDPGGAPMLPRASNGSAIAVETGEKLSSPSRLAVSVAQDVLTKSQRHRGRRHSGWKAKTTYEHMAKKEKESDLSHPHQLLLIRRSPLCFGGWYRDFFVTSSPNHHIVTLGERGTRIPLVEHFWRRDQASACAFVEGARRIRQLYFAHSGAFGA